MLAKLKTPSFLSVINDAVKDETVAVTNDKTLNKVNPNEFDPLQEKNKKAEEIKREQKSSEVSINESPALPPTPANVVKTTNPQMGEYYGAQPIYGLHF